MVAISLAAGVRRGVCGYPGRRLRPQAIYARIREARRDNAHPLTVVTRLGCGHGRGARIEGDHMHFGSIRRCSQGIGCEVLRTGFRHKV